MSSSFQALPTTLDEQPEGSFLAFIQAKPGITVFIVLGILTLLCLCLGLTNIVLIHQRWRKRNDLITASERHIGETLTGYQFIFRNRALIGFYFFSVLSLVI